MKFTQYMLSTEDNPHNPFEDYRSWWAFDTAHGYNCASLVGRLAVVTEELSEAVYAQAVSDAIDTIIAEHEGGPYVKVSKVFDESAAHNPL